MGRGAKLSEIHCIRALDRIRNASSPDCGNILDSISGSIKL